MIGALIACVGLVSACVQDTHGDPRPRPAPVPGIRRFVSSDRLVTLEVRDPSANVPHETPLEPTFRLVRRSSSGDAPGPTPRRQHERDYAPLGEADVVLAVGGLPGPAAAAAMLDRDGTFAVLTRLGLDVFGSDGEVLASIPARKLAESAAEVIHLGDLSRLGDGVGASAPSLTAHPTFEVGAALIPAERAVVLARRIERGHHVELVQWSLQHIDLESHAIEPMSLHELRLDAALVAAAPEADVLVALAALDGRSALLRTVARDERVPLAARLRAAWHLGDEARDIGRALVSAALVGADAPRPDVHTVLVALSAARRFPTQEAIERGVALLAGSHFELAVTELFTSLGAPAFEALAAAYFATPESDAAETGLHRALFAVAEGESPELDTPVDDFVVAVLARPDGPSRQTFLQAVARGRPRYPRLAGALDAAQLRAFLAQGGPLERNNPYVTPHRAVVGVLIESLDAPVPKERLDERLAALAHVADLTAQRTGHVWTPAPTAEEWRAWWQKARLRPQSAELLSHAVDRRFVALRLGVEACLAAGDRVHRKVAARALTAVGPQLRLAGLRPLGERVLEGWRPADADEQAARQALREVISGRRDSR